MTDRRDGPPRASLLQAEAAAHDLGRRMKTAMPSGWGFTLVLFSYGAEGFMTYISTAARDETIALLRELVPKIERDLTEQGP